MRRPTYGWREVKDHEPGVARRVHDCHYCGQPEVNIYRASPSMGPPLMNHKTDHQDPFQCIAYLRGKLDAAGIK